MEQKSSFLSKVAENLFNFSLAALVANFIQFSLFFWLPDAWSWTCDLDHFKGITLCKFSTGSFVAFSAGLFSNVAPQAINWIFAIVLFLAAPFVLISVFVLFRFSLVLIVFLAFLGPSWLLGPLLPTWATFLIGLPTGFFMAWGVLVFCDEVLGVQFNRGKKTNVSDI